MCFSIYGSKLALKWLAWKIHRRKYNNTIKKHIIHNIYAEGWGSSFFLSQKTCHNCVYIEFELAVADPTGGFKAGYPSFVGDLWKLCAFGNIKWTNYGLKKKTFYKVLYLPPCRHRLDNTICFSDDARHSYLYDKCEILDKKKEHPVLKLNYIYFSIVFFYRTFFGFIQWIILKFLL